MRRAAKTDKTQKADPWSCGPINPDMEGLPIIAWKFSLPIRTVSPNQKRREHWATQARRAKSERAAFFLLTPRVGIGAGLIVRLTRFGKRLLDDDNLAGSFKAIRDGIADRLGVKDNDPRIKWTYAQEIHKQYSVRVVIEPTPVDALRAIGVI